MLKGRRMNDGLFPNYDTPTQYNMGGDALSQGQPFSLYKDPNNPGTYYAGPPSKSGGKLPKKRADLVAVVTQSLASAFTTYSGSGGATADNAKKLMEALSIAKKILTPEEFLKAERNAKLLGKEGETDDYTEDEVNDLVKGKIEKWARADPSHVVKKDGKAFVRFVNDDLMKLRNKLIRDSNVRYYNTDAKDITDDVIDDDVVNVSGPALTAATTRASGWDKNKLPSDNAKAIELEKIVEEFRAEYQRVAIKWDDQKGYSKRRTGIISGLTRLTLDGAAKRIARAGRRKYKKCKNGKKRMLSIVSTCSKSKSKKRRSLSKKLRVLRASFRKKKGSKSKSPKSKSKSKSPKSKSKSKKAKGSKRRVSAWNKHVKAFCKSHLGKGKKYASLPKCVKAAKKTYKSKARK
jgi:hypothetical protein